MSSRTRMDALEAWIVEALTARGGQARFRDLVGALEHDKEAELTAADRQPQKGHERESSFFYRCRWAATRLRGSGILRSRSPHGVLELAGTGEGATKEPARVRQGSVVPSSPATPRVWIFQANPKYFRILQALAALEEMNWLANRYARDMRTGDTALIWMSGRHAGIYAQARLVGGVADRTSDGPEAEFWADSNAATQIQPRVRLRLEKRFLGNPVLKTRIEEVERLRDLLILRQPTGTVFPVEQAQWASLLDLFPRQETTDPDPTVLKWSISRTRRGTYYERPCGELLESFVAERFADGKVHSRDEVTSWFEEHYPLFEQITVQCHIEKYTTNFRSRVHYDARPEHDLLFREDRDWNRLRLYRAGSDPAPIHGRPVPGPGGSPSPVERHRRLLEHLAGFGEVSSEELGPLGVRDSELVAWMDALLIARPGAYVASPLFLQLIEGGADPVQFTSRLAATFMGEHVCNVLKNSVEPLEKYVWEHFGAWHLAQPGRADSGWLEYLSFPVSEPPSRGASERLDLFAQLPPESIGALVRSTEFLAEQQNWSAQLGGLDGAGILSRQLQSGIRRPLFLCSALLGDDGGEPEVKMISSSAARCRRYVVAGLPLIRDDEDAPPKEWDAVASRLLEHPLYVLITQLEVQRLFAGVSGEAAPQLEVTSTGECHLVVAERGLGQLWQFCQRTLQDLRYLGSAEFQIIVECKSVQF